MFLLDFFHPAINMLYTDFSSCNLCDLFITFKILFSLFFWWILEFSPHTLVSSVNKSNFTSIFPVWITLLLCLSWFLSLKYAGLFQNVSLKQINFSLDFISLSKYHLARFYSLTAVFWKFLALTLSIPSLWINLQFILFPREIV